MPKAASSKNPYHLSLPSPTGLPARSTLYRRLHPSTPTPRGKRPLRGPLHEFASMVNPAADLKEEEYSPQARRAALAPAFRLPMTPQRTSAIRIGGDMPETKLEDVGVAMSPQFEGGTQTGFETPTGIQYMVVTRGLAGLKRERRQVLRALALESEIKELEARVHRLECSERRLKCQVSKEKELVKDIRVERDESRAELVRAEEKLDDMEAAMFVLRREFNQYRGWWLTENRSLEVALREVPKRKWNEGLRAIASSSRGRYMSYCGDGSN